MGKPRRALGRGLDALIPPGEPEKHSARLDDIVPSGAQPRKHFDQATLEELADSIRVHGIIQPLIVGPVDGNGKRPLIAGERRWQAAKLAGLDSVPIVERTAEPEGVMEIALVENLQREDLAPLEEAAAFERLARDHGLTQEQISVRLGRSRSSIANTMRLNSLPSSVRAALADGRISEGHARALLGVEDVSDLETVLDRTTSDGLNVRQTEKLVASLRKLRPADRAARPKPAMLAQLEGDLRRRFGTKVTVTKGRKTGRIVIEYYSDEELAALAERLLTD